MMNRILGLCVVLGVMIPALAQAMRHDNEPDCTADPECTWRGDADGLCLCLMSPTPNTLEPITLPSNGGWMCSGGADEAVAFRGKTLIAEDGTPFIMSESELLTCEPSDERRLPRDVLPRNRVEFLSLMVGRALTQMVELRTFAYETAIEADAYCAAGDTLNEAAQTTVELLECLAGLSPEVRLADACRVCGCAGVPGQLRISAANHNTTRSNRLCAAN